MGTTVDELASAVLESVNAGARVINLSVGSIAGFFGSAPSGGPFSLPFVQEKNEEQKQSRDQEREQDGSILGHRR